ncbi:transgelin-2-like isoform X1 [Haliotis rufescens]|uniref:transgelin-2-like isoform X1 n=1 Tax=Haliotis rufescens TaxID=6454 RepID=UPI00201F1FB4|nr:transgelin-2-like isoform X1 [Haliotis rufescens]
MSICRNYRAPKYGDARDTQMKINKKYDSECAGEMLNWVASMTGESFNTAGDMDNFQEVLKDGVLLGKLANALKPGSIPAKKLKSTTLSFKQMELIQLAVDVFKQMGVKDTESFQSVDLTERVNLNQVVICLQSVGRKAGHGPKEAQENRRDFSDEQLKAGQSVIGLQMGTNQHASQAGMSLGKMRMITNDEKQ